LIKSLSLNVTTSISSSNEILYKYLFDIDVSLSLPSAEIEYKSFNIQVPKEELEKENVGNDVTFVLEPVKYNGFGADTSPIVSVTRG